VSVILLGDTERAHICSNEPLSRLWGLRERVEAALRLR
jgi:hypothetical protein